MKESYILNKRQYISISSLFNLHNHNYCGNYFFELNKMERILLDGYIFQFKMKSYYYHHHLKIDRNTYSDDEWLYLVIIDSLQYFRIHHFFEYYENKVYEAVKLFKKYIGLIFKMNLHKKSLSFIDNLLTSSENFDFYYSFLKEHNENIVKYLNFPKLVEFTLQQYDNKLLQTVEMDLECFIKSILYYYDYGIKFKHMHPDKQKEMLINVIQTIKQIEPKYKKIFKKSLSSNLNYNFYKFCNDKFNIDIDLI